MFWPSVWRLFLEFIANNERWRFTSPCSAFSCSEKGPEKNMACHHTQLRESLARTVIPSGKLTHRHEKSPSFLVNTRVSMAVIGSRTLVSWVISPTYPGRIQPTFIGVKESIDPKYRQDIPVPLKFWWISSQRTVSLKEWRVRVTWTRPWAELSDGWCNNWTCTLEVKNHKKNSPFELLIVNPY